MRACVLGWAPTTPLKEGLKYTYDWIQTQVEAYSKEEGKSLDTLTKSVVVTQTMTDSCDMGNKGDGKSVSIS